MTDPHNAQPPQPIVQIAVMTDAPGKDFPGLNCPVKRGDRVLTFCHIQRGGGWWCGPYMVKYTGDDYVAYRPKWAKVDKISKTWIIAP